MEEYNGYVGAPYNFIELNKKVNQKNEEELPSHGQIDSGKKSGIIEYEIEAKTPIMIDDGKGKFYRNVYGNFAIPGSSVRGLVRSNMQILSFSTVADDIQNGKFMFRNVANGKEKDYYNEVLGNKTVQYNLSKGKKGQFSVLENVRAGYIRNAGNKYEIIPTKVDTLSNESGSMNYYLVSERKIIESNDKHFSFLLEHDPYILQNTRAEFKQKTDKQNRVHYRGISNDNYSPYYMKISYEVSGIRNVSGIDKWGKLSHNGYLVSTGQMSEKKAIYVIPEIDESKGVIPISAQDIDDFKRDYEGRKNQVEAMEAEGNKGFFDLPAMGETKPVFYIQLDGKLYFGFTPRLRLFYDKEIYEGLSKQQKDTKVDYCKAIFGYSDQQGSYKTRVSFLDAEAVKEKGVSKGVKLVLASPKPTSYLDYLTSADHEPVSYNDDFELRGVKQYWLKTFAIEGQAVKNDNTSSSFQPLKEGTIFKGTIRFENLSDEELGMLLWSLALEKNSNQNIGKAKAYGYGRISVKVTGLRTLKYDEMYRSTALSLNPYDLDFADKYIEFAKTAMTTFLGQDVMANARIKHFFMMKDATKILDNDKTRYMSIEEKDGKEYQNRVRDKVMLPSVEDVVNGKPIMYERNKKKGRSGVKGNSRENKDWKDYKEKQKKTSSQSCSTSMKDLFKGIKLDN